MVRDIIKIDEEKCTGCGLCVSGCPEGAIQLIDGKARLVSETYCDGLGACIGECPEDAITVEKREADTYSESNVMERVISQGDGVIRAHLAHLNHHGEDAYLEEALGVLREKGYDTAAYEAELSGHEQETDSGAAAAETPAEQPVIFTCPGSASRKLKSGNSGTTAEDSGESAPGVINVPGRLTHWPVQLHLLSPGSSFFKRSDLLLAADCTAYTMGGFHEKLLKGKTLAIACPKLDSSLDVYYQKLVKMIDEAEINTLTVAVMTVPCCNGLVALAKKAAEDASRKVPVKRITIDTDGSIVGEEWL